MSTSELGFEDAIEKSLVGAGGYLRSEPENYDAFLGLDPVELFAFIERTQPKQWGQLVARGYGRDHAAAKKGFAKRLAAELDARGTVDVLRHDVTDYGVTIRLAFFRPAHGLTPDLEVLYRANRVTLTRQFVYEADSKKSIDLAILVNGILTSTAELKNPLTGQTIENAKAQYREDRDPGNVSLSRRAIVHFAVDPTELP